MGLRRCVFYQGGDRFTEDYEGKFSLSSRHSLGRNLGLRTNQKINVRQGWNCIDSEWAKLLFHIGRRMESFVLDRETIYRLRQVPREWDDGVDIKK